MLVNQSCAKLNWAELADQAPPTSAALIITAVHHSAQCEWPELCFVPGLPSSSCCGCAATLSSIGCAFVTVLEKPPAVSWPAAAAESAILLAR